MVPLVLYPVDVDSWNVERRQIRAVFDDKGQPLETGLVGVGTGREEKGERGYASCRQCGTEECRLRGMSKTAGQI
jgi:hypothetical protein